MKKLKKKNETAVMVVVYPGVEDYFIEYLESIKCQSTNEFDLLIYNDGLQDLDTTFDFQGLDVTFIDQNSAFSVSDNRMFMIRYAINEGYSYLVFTDADDLLSNNRIEESVKCLCQDAPVVFNECIILGSNEAYFKGQLPNRVSYAEQLMHYNFMGLSNTAIHLQSLKTVIHTMEVPSDIMAFDWYFFSVLLNEGVTFCRMDMAFTFYRIHDTNIAGDRTLNVHQLNHGIRVKELHYKNLAQVYEQYKCWYDITLEFIEHMSSGSSVDYIEKANSMKYCFWWENINLKYFIEVIDNDI